MQLGDELCHRRSLGHPGKQWVIRVPWRLTSESAVVARFDEASNKAFQTDRLQATTELCVKALLP